MIVIVRLSLFVFLLLNLLAHLSLLLLLKMFPLATK